jgi:hypothetical protein
MKAREGFTKLVRGTEEMRHLLQLMEDEPLRLFTSICQQYERTERPVPDHSIRRSTYIQEIALKALTSAGLVEQEPGGRLSLYQYKPTSKGLTQFKKLMAEAESPS